MNGMCISKTIQWPFSDYSVPFGHQRWKCILVRFRHFYYIFNWYLDYNPARTAKGDNTLSVTQTYVFICLWILCSFRKFFTLREQWIHTSFYTSPVDNTRVSKYSCVTLWFLCYFKKACNTKRTAIQTNIVIQKISLYKRLK